MQYVKIATAVFLIEGEPPEHEYQADVIYWQEKVWFVASTFLEHATGKRIPAELVPLPLLAPLTNDQEAVPLGRKLPKELLGNYPVPASIRTEFQVVDVFGISNTPQPGSARH